MADWYSIMNGFRNWDWNLVPSFLAVLDAGSLSAAARASGISQPTLTRHIAELETVLGVMLFDRGREGARPTEAAIAIGAAAKAMADCAGSMEMASAGRATGVEGTVRVTASQIVATYLLPEILGAMLQQMPNIDIELVATNEVENLLRRDADIALRMVEPQQLDLISRKLATLELGVYAHRDYLARHGIPQSLADMHDHIMIGYDRSELVLRGFKSIGYPVDRNFFRYRSDDQVAAWQAVLGGAGIGFAPVWLGSRYPQLQRIGEGFSIPPMHIWLVTHKELRTSARIRAVHDHLATAIAAMKLGG